MDIKEIVYGIVMMICAGLLSFTATPLVSVLAYRIHAVDVPRDDRRMHDHPIPRMGGLAIFFGFIVTTFIFDDVDMRMTGIMLGAAAMVLLGVFDDIFRLNALLKFGVQIAISAIPVLFGVTIERVNLFGSYVHFGVWAIPATMLWIVAITNAVNLIDGLDGLACGVSTISAFSILFFILLSPEINLDAAVMTAILAGSCMGFLPFNFNPAKIFMGDTGALFLGYMLANISVVGLFKANFLISFGAPFLILGLPIADTLTAIVRRVSRGQSPFSPDRSHLHHKLIDIGFSQKQSVMILYALSALLGTAAIICTDERFVSAFVLLVIVLIIGLLNWRVFRSKSERRLSGVRMRSGNDKNEAAKKDARAEKEDPKT